MRPPSLFGEYGLAARQRSREGGAGKGDLVRNRRPERHPHADDPLPESYERMGLKQITMQPGDIMVMPEATTHLVYPWVPTDRARQVIGFRYQMRTCSLIGSLKRDLKQVLRRTPRRGEALAGGDAGALQPEHPRAALLRALHRDQGHRPPRGGGRYLVSRYD